MAPVRRQLYLGGGGPAGRSAARRPRPGHKAAVPGAAARRRRQGREANVSRRQVDASEACQHELRNGRARLPP
ncbi:hypothetical protein ACP4OV_023931 [Aristida adscensionis]